MLFRGQETPTSPEEQQRAVATTVVVVVGRFRVPIQHHWALEMLVVATITRTSNAKQTPTAHQTHPNPKYGTNKVADTNIFAYKYQRRKTAHLNTTRWSFRS